jgi:hypothetical protein
MATKVYLIECESGKYYVGRTNCVDKRILQHFTGNGSKWTQLYKPIKVVKILDGSDIFEEEKQTYLAMDKYGIDNVRGGCYSAIKLSEYDKKKITEFIRSMKNECYICGSKSHFANDCPDNNVSTKSICLSHYRSNIIIGNKKDGADLSIEKYNNFKKKCEGECEHCNNTRIEYKNNDGEHYIYVSCVFCYCGDDWPNDMFVVLSNSK